MALFTPSRPDGRSDRRVVYELVEGAEPGTTFTYEELTAALQEGVETEIQRVRVYRAVAKANKTLQRERKRTIAPVPGVGYRMAFAEEHHGLAIVKKSRADTQLHQALGLLTNVRWDELSEPHLTLHRGQVLILGGVIQMMGVSERRHAKQEKALEEIRQQQAEIAQRLDKIEGVVTDDHYEAA